MNYESRDSCHPLEAMTREPEHAFHFHMLIIYFVTQAFEYQIKKIKNMF